MVLTGRASAAQERLYFLNRLQPGNPGYIVTFALRFIGPLDTGALTAAIRAVFARHDALRTTYSMRDGLVMQHIRPDACARIEVRTSHRSDRGSQDRELRELVSDQARQPFSLEEGPILRAFIRSWGPDEHAVAILVHHIACDGWSVGILLGDIAAHYNAAVRPPGDTSQPAEPAPSYFAYAQALRDSENQRGLEFWRKNLDGAPHLALPTDFPRPGELSYRGDIIRVPLDRDLISQLSEWATSRGVTFFAVVLAAYAHVLARYARQDEVVIGVPAANRLESEHERLVGCLVNTLPMRIDLTGGPSFADLLTRVWTAWLSAFGYQDVPFQRIVQVTATERLLSHTPLFQTVLSVQNFPFALPELDGLEVSEVEVEIAAAKSDIGVTMELTADPPFLRAEYSTDLFEKATAAGILRHYLTFLRSVVAGTGAEPSMVDAAERHRLLVEANPPVTAGPPEHPSVLARFSERVAAAPAAVAVRHQGHDVTYRELDEWSAQIAAGLRDAGVCRGDAVGVLLRRSPAVVAAMLGVWKAGAVYVPLDPGLPSHRMNLIVGAAGLSVTLVEAQTVGTAQALAGDRGMDLIDVWRNDRRGEVPATFPVADELAYVMFTSGSTGAPKGVRVRHAGLNALYSPTPAGLNVTAADVWTCAHSFSFDVSVWETWAALTSGGRLLIVDEAEAADPDRLVALVQAEQVTVLGTTTGTLYRLLPAYLRLLDGEVSPVRYIDVGGEALSWSRLAALAAASDGLRATFVNMYGVTECTCTVTTCQVAAKDLASVREGAIGTPLPSARCYVLDDRLQPVGLNVPGELYVAGVVVADGYANNPELTAARFLPDPYVNGVMYKTGDIVKWATDGTLVYLGRDDTQVKIRGHRVECGDVAAAFLRHPAVRSCSVAADGGELLAFVCTDLGADAERSLRRHVKDLLPGYMVPSRIVTVPEIPLTANDKVDLSRLLATDRAVRRTRDLASCDPQARGTALEERIRGMWAAVLDREDVGLTDNFFDIGGNSFAMIELQKLMADGGLDVTVSDLFKFGTVAACAAYFGPDGPAPAVVSSPAQRRLGQQALAARRRAAGHAHD